MKQLIRHIIKNKAYALINLFGLTLGLSVSIFILLFVQDEMNYDRYLPGYDQVLRIQPVAPTENGTQEWATTEGFLIAALTPMYPDITASTRVLRNDNDIVFSTETEKHAQGGVIGADSSFFRVFPFTFIEGDEKSAFKNPDALILTRDIAKKYFGNEKALGKILTADFGTYTITGVIENVPTTSHFHFTAVFPIKRWWRQIDESRNAYAAYSYIRIATPEKAITFGKEFLHDWYRNNGYGDDKPKAEDPAIVLNAMPLQDIHLQSHAEKEFEANGQWQVVYVFIAVAILLIVIAMVNYINLSNAMAIRRSKEVGVRKTIGATRQRLFLSFMMESYVFTFIAFLFGLTAVVFLLPQFNLFTGKAIALSTLLNLPFILGIVGTWIILGFLSGLYPAMLLSSFSPIQAMKANATNTMASSTSRYLRQGLIVSQFTISALMIVCAFTVKQQLSFIEGRDVGFNKKNVVVVQLAGDSRQKLDALKNELAKLKSVSSTSATSATPGKRVVILVVRVPDLAGTREGQTDDDGTREMRVMSVDADFVKTLGLTIQEGRDFIAGSAADSAGAFILNEAAVKAFNLKEPIGKPFEYTFYENKKGSVVGVVRDFNFASAHSAVEPVMLHIMPNFISTLCIRLNEGNPHTALAEIEGAWKNVTAAPFSYQFLDETYDAMYRTEQTTGKVITTFTILALVIAGLGLFGIVSFFVAQRIKEVGVRKVFGASQVSLIALLSKEYVIMVAIGNLVAIYPSYLLVMQWLQQFAYRIDLSFSTFLIAFLLSEIMAFASIILVVAKTARLNPSTILRYE